MALQNEPLGDGGKANAAEIATLLVELDDWEVLNGDMAQLQKRYSFGTFAEALAFVNDVGAIAEEQGHHPEIPFTWGAATVRWWSHSLGGITRNDFIMAAKTDGALS